MSLPTISVVIPTYNRPEFLLEAVQSALDQTVDILEVIVVDDVSDQDPSVLLAQFGEKLRCVSLAQKGGGNVARNRGIELARGDLIGFLDDDDIWLPQKLHAQITAMGQNYDACLCASQEVGSPPKPPRILPEVTGEVLKRSTPCGTSGLLATRKVLQTENFDPSIKRGQDWDLFVRLAQHKPLAFVGQPLYLRRTGHDRITTKALSQTPEELLTAAAAVHKHRDWLGEASYRWRIARILLSFISQRRGKLRYVWSALRHAGLQATLSQLTKKTRGSMMAQTAKRTATPEPDP